MQEEYDVDYYDHEVVRRDVQKSQRSLSSIQMHDGERALNDSHCETFHQHQYDIVFQKHSPTFTCRVLDEDGFGLIPRGASEVCFRYFMSI